MSDTRTITSQDARTGLQKCFEKQRPVFLWGPPGIGKSELVADIAKDMKGHMIDLRLGQMDPTDIRGIPFYNKDNGLMDWAPPIDLPSEELAKEYPVLVGNGLIRELHVYGYNTSVGDKPKASQHRGIGSKLLRKAELITWLHNYNGIVVISGEGVKEYYRKKGYTEKDTFMVKKFRITFYKFITILLSTIISIISSYLFWNS